MSLDEIEAYLTKKIMKTNPNFTVTSPILIKCTHGYRLGLLPGVIWFTFCRVCPKSANCDSMKRIIREMQGESA